MRLVAKHAQVGYKVPGERPACRNCVELTTLGEDNGIGIPLRVGCRRHGFEVTAGAICDDYYQVMPRAGRTLAQSAQLWFPNLGSGSND